MATELELRVYDALVAAVERQVDRGRSDLQFFLILNASLVAGALATLQFAQRAEAVTKILADPDAYVSPKIRAGSSTDWGQWALRGFALLHILSAVVLSNALMGCAARAVPCTPVG